MKLGNDYYYISSKVIKKIVIIWSINIKYTWIMNRHFGWKHFDIDTFNGDI